VPPTSSGAGSRTRAGNGRATGDGGAAGVRGVGRRMSGDRPRWHSGRRQRM